MYEQQKVEFEAALVRSELEPVPGDWWIENVGDVWAPKWVAKEGKCCALSPTYLERQLAFGTSRKFAAYLLGVSAAWISGALFGFDDVGNDLTGEERDSEDFMDGFEWGKYMREKYVEGVSDGS